MKQIALFFLSTSVTVFAGSVLPTGDIAEAPENGDKIKSDKYSGTVREIETEEMYSLSPWMEHVAIEEEYRRWSLPMFRCRTALFEELRVAGHQVERAASRALEKARDLLDAAAQRLYTTLPATPEKVGLTDPEIATIQASLDRRDRDSASEILEERLDRSRSTFSPSPEVTRVRDYFIRLYPKLWSTFLRHLFRSTAYLNLEEKEKLNSFAECVAFELNETINNNPLIISQPEQNQDVDGA